MLTISDDWKKSYPDGHVGILAMKNVANPDRHTGLHSAKEDLEADLRSLFTDPAKLKTLQPIKAYTAYYKRFKKTYHVLQQLESVVFKGKPIPKVAALVEAMFWRSCGTCSLRRDMIWISLTPRSYWTWQKGMKNT